MSVEIKTIAATLARAAAIGHHARAVHIGQDRFARIVFGNRHMLDGGGVEYQFRLFIAENLLDARGIAHIGDQRCASKWTAKFSRSSISMR